MSIADACNSSFSSFLPVSEDCVRDVIMKSPSTSCSLDPIPTWLLKKCLNGLLPVLTQIINMSIENDQFCWCSEMCSNHSFLKKPNFDCEILKNHRPVANLKFLTRTIERVLLWKLMTIYLQTICVAKCNLLINVVTVSKLLCYVL